MSLGAVALSAMFTFESEGFGGPIYFDDVECVGNETSIFNCLHNGLGNHDCFNFEDAGVRCPSGSHHVVQLLTALSLTVFSYIVSLACNNHNVQTLLHDQM